MTLNNKKLPNGLNVCMNCEIIPLHRVGLVAIRLRAAAELAAPAKTATH